MSILSRLRASLKPRDGAAAIEYGLIVALVAVIAITVVSAAGPDLDRPLPTPDRPAPAVAE